MSKIILFLGVSMCFKSDWVFQGCFYVFLCVSRVTMCFKGVSRVFQGCISGYSYFPSCSTMGRIVGLIVSFENIIE